MKPEVASASSITGGIYTDSVTCVNSTSDSERANGNFRQNVEIMVNISYIEFIPEQLSQNCRQLVVS